jgi:branched-chain amino acid transport system permease protein
MGIGTSRLTLAAFAAGAALCGLGGGAWSALQGTSIEPGAYDFQLSIGVLCAVIVGGLGSLPGVVVGVLLMFGLNQIVLVQITGALGLTGANAAVWAQPTNWKYFIFGLALVLMMRYRPQGLWPEGASK